jgi:hypothetical protein
MGGVLSTVGEGLKQSFLMAYEVWWALVLGFAISGIVQAWVPRERIEAALSGSGSRPVAWATGLGARLPVPTTRPSRGDIFGSVQLDYKLALNSIALVVFAVLFSLAKQTRAAHAAERPEIAASSSATRGS